MKIQVDKEGREAVEQLCDIALKAGGTQNLNGIVAILKAVTDIKEEVEENGN